MGLPVRAFIVLMIAVFTVSMGFGIVLPLLPFLIERLLGAGAQADQVSRTTDLLTAIYTLFLFASLASLASLYPETRRLRAYP